MTKVIIGTTPGQYCAESGLAFRDPPQPTALRLQELSILYELVAAGHEIESQDIIICSSFVVLYETETVWLIRDGGRTG